MEESKKWYSLYNNESQDKLLACASSEEKIKEVSEFYATGVWFEYDDINNILHNERLYGGKVSFPETPKARSREVVPPKKEFKWVA
jgi:hypothetical protein